MHDGVGNEIVAVDDVKLDTQKKNSPIDTG